MHYKYTVRIFDQQDTQWPTMATEKYALAEHKHEQKTSRHESIWDVMQ